MEIVEAEPLFAERAAGIDIGKAGVAAAVRLPGPGGRRMQEVRESGTTRAELEELADWLDSHQVTRVGMESTGDYWKPVFFTLERRGFECLLYNSRQVKAQPGRPKTDKADALWLARITENGWVRSSFVPPEEIRVLREHTRYRRKLIQARTAEKNRVEGLLEDGHLKLSSVISDIHGVSGRAMLDSLAAGVTDPRVLAAHARGSMKAKTGRRRGAGLHVLHPRPGPAAAPDAGHPGLLHHPGRGTGRRDRGPVRHVRGRDHPDRPDPRDRPPHRRGRHRRDRGEHGRFPHLRAPGVLGQTVPPGPRVRRLRRAGMPPATATPTCPPPSAKPSSAPCAPTPSPQPGTKG